MAPSRLGVNTYSQAYNYAINNELIILGGTLDAVITQETTGCPDCVVVEDVGLSDHHLLRWDVNTTRSTPSVASVRARPWRHLDMELFRSALSTTRQFHPDDWSTDIDETASL